MAEQLAGIPPEDIQLVGTALAEAGLEAKAQASPTLVIALADHIGFALRRRNLGMIVEYPLLAEVQHLYADEYAQAVAVLAAINTRLPDPLAESEAVALALHIVNAGIATGDLSYTFTMTGIIQQMIAVIGQSSGQVLDMGSVSVGRLITHLRYLFVRISQHSQLDQEISAVGLAIREAYPRALECAQRLDSVIELRLGVSLTEDEISYLTLHVARVTMEQA
ncbi:MAG TPA: transcription antiterminator [Propionibacteriaceae bacterium]|nr:transcription antiterminator [Propionibacteriaceae bacterium]